MKRLRAFIAAGVLIPSACLFLFCINTNSMLVTSRPAVRALKGGGMACDVAGGIVAETIQESVREYQSKIFTDTLSTYTTPVCGTDNCVTNIKLAAQKCDGIIIPGGSVFSFNDTVGEQTAAAGFKTADAIYNGEIIQAYGGGICQVSSTIFAAALYTDLDILEHWNHDYISSYIDAGMDAAVAWGALDMRIHNTSPYPIRIDITCTDEYLTAAIIGTKTDDSIIEVETKVLETSTPQTLDIATRRLIYTADKSQVFIRQVAISSYVL